MTQWDWNLVSLVALTAIIVGAIVYGSGKRGSLFSRRVLGSLGFVLYISLLLWLVYGFATAGI